jgi:glycosyltransferase involved in cell wall biosynthesis
MMHIVYLTHEYPKKGINGGGIGSVVQFLGRQLISREIHVSVVGMNNSFINEYENDNGVQVYRLAKSTWKLAKFYDNKKRVLKKIKQLNSIRKIDIVEGSELNFAFFEKKTSYKKIIRLHGGHHFFAIELGLKPALWRGFQEKKSFNRADGYIAVSNYVGAQTQKYLQNNFNYTTIHNSVDTDKFKPTDIAMVKKNTLLFVGTVCEKKGIQQLVQAIPIIKESVKDIHLKIVGRDWKFPDGSSYVNYLKTFITEDIKDQIEIVGPVPHYDVIKYIEEADICLYPSHMEAMPIAWLEGLSMGKKVIASDIGPGREAIKNNITGILINPYLPKDIAEKVVLMLNNTNYENMGVAARKDILIRFNVDKIIQENIEFYNHIIH